MVRFPGLDPSQPVESVTQNFTSTLTDQSNKAISCSVSWSVTVSFNNGVWSASVNGQPVPLSLSYQ